VRSKYWVRIEQALAYWLLESWIGDYRKEFAIIA